MKIYELAEQIATEAHKNQTRWDKKTPYIVHCKAVYENTKVLLKKFGYESSLLFANASLAAAWLHDVWEDQSESYPIERIEKLLAEYSPEIEGDEELAITIKAVMAITKNPNKEDESYFNYLDRVKNNPIAKIVKIADLTHNMSDLKSGSRRDKYELAMWFLLN